MYDNHIKRLRNCATRAAPCKTCDLYGDVCCTDTLMKQAAYAIEELSEQLENETEYATALNSYVPQWIPVAERIPSADGFTLIFTAHGNPGVCYFTSGWWGGYDKDGITHWMPLPEPPEKERES